MKFLALVAIIVVLAIVQTYAEETCKPGETKYVDCNSCQCTRGVFSCTKRICSPKFQNHKICTPNQTYKKDCNTCSCNKDGTNELCTLMACGSISN